MPKIFVGRPISDEIDSYLFMVDAEAERLRHVTPAQEAVYQQKILEAEAGGGDLLLAEAQALGVELPVVCGRVQRARGDWERQAHRVEVARVEAKAAIRSATTPDDMHGALLQFKEKADG